MATLLTTLIVTVDSPEELTKIKSENSANENLDYALIRSQQKEPLTSPVNAVVFERDDILERNEDIKTFFQNTLFTFIISDIANAGTAFAIADLAKEAGSDPFIVFTGAPKSYKKKLLDNLKQKGTPFIVTKKPVKTISGFITSIPYSTKEYQPVDILTLLFWKEVFIEPFTVPEFKNYYKECFSCRYDKKPVKIIIILNSSFSFLLIVKKEVMAFLPKPIPIYSNIITFSNFVQTTIRGPPEKFPLNFNSFCLIKLSLKIFRKEKCYVKKFICLFFNRSDDY